MLPPLVAVVFATLTPPAPPCASQDSAPVTAFVNASVIPMDRPRVLNAQTVVVRNGRIAAMGPAPRVTVPAGARLIDASGQYLIPGLGEMHAHIPVPDQGDEYIRQVLFLFVANGVTTIRGMLGHPSHLALRERVEAGAVLGPRIWTAGPSVSGTSVSTVHAADSAARATQTAGYDFIKIHPGLLRPVFDTLDAVADRIGIRYAGHVPVAVGVPRALGAGYWSIDHLDSYLDALVPGNAPDSAEDPGFFGIALIGRVDEAQIPRLARATRIAGVWNVPTQVLMENMASDEDPALLAERPEMRYMPSRTVEGWIAQKREFLARYPAADRRTFLDVRRRLIKALEEARAGLALGSDAPQWWNVPGFSALRELAALVASGLTPYQALETATRNVAVFLGRADRAGTITPGKDADLLLLQANPLDDITNVSQQSGVMIRGVWIPREGIRRGLDDIASRYAR